MSEVMGEPTDLQSPQAACPFSELESASVYWLVVSTLPL